MAPEDLTTITPAVTVRRSTLEERLSERQKRWAGVIIVVIICLVSFWVALNPVLVLRGQRRRASG